MSDALQIEKRRSAIRRFFRRPRYLWRAAFCPTFSMVELFALALLVGWVHSAVVDQLSYVALVCAERFVP